MTLRDSVHRALLDASPDAIVATTGDGRIVLVNAQAEALFGYHRSELLGRGVDMLVPMASRTLHARLRKDYVADDPAPRPMGEGRELTGRRRDGTEFAAEISLSPIETDDGMLLCAAVRDVTERLLERAARDRLVASEERLRAVEEKRALEVQLHRAQRLESLGQLAGGIAHDFNNLLALIVNYTSFVREEVEVATGGPEGAHWRPVLDDVDQIARAGDRAVELVHQLLAFGRREVVRPRVLNLNAVLEGIEPILRRSLGEHIELVLDQAPALWSTTADSGQLEQAMVNLAVNARDAMPDGGRLTVRTSNVVADEYYCEAHPGSTPGRYVRLDVSDTGAGMSPEVLTRAFEPFFTTKPPDEGSGLGLATVYGIVSQAGGFAQMYSEPGTGTTFRALLPVSDDALSAEPLPESRPVRRSETVLVVEDSEPLREVARRVLVRNGHTVLVAASGAEAAEIALSYPGDIHLLLTDVIMPKTLGREVAQQVTALRPGIRVLFMSGYAQPTLAARGRLSDHVLMVEKPFSQASLLTMVAEALDSPV